MTSGLQKFLEGIIDYAGLFPPADLSMGEAINNYARYRQETDNWMLSRFVCPAERLHELVLFEDILFHTPEPFRFSVLGKPSLDHGEFEKNLRETLQEITDFNHQHGSNVTTEVLELSFPQMVLSQADHYAALKRTGQILNESSPVPLQVFFEVNQGDTWLHTVAEAMPAIADFNAEHHPSGMLKQAGFKMRTGDTKSNMYPTVEEVAQVIKLSRNEDVPIKAMAGLHHPIRYFDEVHQVWVHGFFNVFLAGILAHSHRLPDIIILSILEDDDPDSFFFKEDYIGWQDVRISVDKLQAIRREKVISVSSSSFDEPREEMIALKLF
ncbi:MAG: hypothetical protein WD267_07045 [Balneolales bacterium]